MIKRFCFILVLVMTLPAIAFTQQQPGLITVTANGVSFKMILVQGGTFTMGADYMPHSVTLSTYYIGETEVTQELWQAVMGSNPSYFKPEVTNAAQCSYEAFVADAKRLNARKPGTVRIPSEQEWNATMVTMTGSLKRPVEYVSWNDCQEFIRKLNQITGRKFRMPTEAEWEFAARGGNKSQGYKYSGSNNHDDVAWYRDNSGNDGTHVVKTKKPNELGIFDMSGNVSEWCQDWYSEYTSEAQTNPKGPDRGTQRIYRGGNCFFDVEEWFDYDRLMKPMRGEMYPDRREATGVELYYMGLRLVLES